MCIIEYDKQAWVGKEVAQVAATEHPWLLAVFDRLGLDGDERVESLLELAQKAAVLVVPEPIVRVSGSAASTVLDERHRGYPALGLHLALVNEERNGRFVVRHAVQVVDLTVVVVVRVCHPGILAQSNGRCFDGMLHAGRTFRRCSLPHKTRGKRIRVYGRFSPCVCLLVNVPRGCMLYEMRIL